jgi:threonine dehydrogenase-like Zn-dependent dehydrogenase
MESVAGPDGGDLALYRRSEEGEIAEQVDLVAGARGLVIGDGRLGLLCAHVLAANGLAVDVAGRHPERAGLLATGAAYASGAEDRQYDIVVEATGSPSMFANALARVRPRGTLVMKTTSEAPAQVDLAPLVVNEIQVVGSRCGPFEPALKALAAGAVPVEGFVAARYPLEQGVEALEQAARPGVLKVLLEVEAPGGASQPG